MSIIDELITDRTAADAERARQLNRKGWDAMTGAERSFYLSAGNKGAYKALDMNRVERAMQYLAGRLDAVGVQVRLTPREWSDGDIPTPEQLEAYRLSVAALRAALAQVPSTPAVPENIPGMGLQGANDLERILFDLDALITNMAAARRHCGVTICGTGGLIH